MKFWISKKKKYSYVLYGLKKNVFLQVDYKQNYTMLKSLMNNPMPACERSGIRLQPGQQLPCLLILKKEKNNNK